jgi:hydroxymethylbilane synthase
VSEQGRRLRLGTRRSRLALAQSTAVAHIVETANPGVTVELVPIVTRGDVLRGSLARLGGKGLFTQELEAGLLDEAIHFAVHSLKDLPAVLPEDLEIAAFPERADPRDVLVSDVAEDLEGLPEGAVLLTGSLRRRAQILAHRPDLRVEAIRGNVDTRLRKWREEKAAGVILAKAGLERLGITEVPAHPLDPEILIPAPGQGTLALETKKHTEAARACARVSHEPSERTARAERRVVRAFGADCTLPLAAWARPDEGESGHGTGPGAGGASDAAGRLRLTALLATPDGRHVARAETLGNDPEDLAEDCVVRLREQGAKEILERIRHGES